MTENSDREKERIFSREGKIGCATILLVIAITYVFILTPMRYSAQAASCRPHMVLTTCKYYSEEHTGIFPPLSPAPGRLLHDLNYFSSDHFCEAQDNDNSGLTELVNVSAEEVQKALEKNRFSDFKYLEDGRVLKIVNKFADFIYLGYAIESEEQFREFFKAYERAIEAGTGFDDDLPVSPGNGTCGSDVLKRLYTLDHPNAACYAANASKIPVAIEWPGHHKRGYPLFYTTYSKVTFLDGHTEDLEYPGKFPMVSEVIEGLREIAAQYEPIPIETDSMY